ncbi:hypothetical protein KDA11_02920 [Candidatus Saccharibacteria bacterium]|nr:hypothetical protein [Candidatus Saccharibacteria bacterium]
MVIHLKGNGSTYSKDVLRFIAESRDGIKYYILKKLHHSGVAITFRKYSDKQMKDSTVTDRLKRKGIKTLPAAVFQGSVFNGPTEVKHILTTIQPTENMAMGQPPPNAGKPRFADPNYVLSSDDYTSSLIDWANDLENLEGVDDDEGDMEDIRREAEKRAARMEERRNNYRDPEQRQQRMQGRPQPQPRQTRQSRHQQGRRGRQVSPEAAESSRKQLSALTNETSSIDSVHDHVMKIMQDMPDDE